MDIASRTRLAGTYLPTSESAVLRVQKVAAGYIDRMFSYELQHLFTYTADLRLPPEVVGPIPEGVRATAYVLGGEISGPRLRGKVLPVGGDWLLLRTDGIGLVDVRLTLQTHDDALILYDLHGRP